MLRTVGRVLVYVFEFSCLYIIVSMVVFILFVKLVLGKDLLVCLQPLVGCCWLLHLLWLICLIANDGHAPRQKEQAAKIMPFYWKGQVIASGIIHTVYVYLASEAWDTIHAILGMGLRITNNIVGELLNSLIFHDNIKCITANGQIVMHVSTEKHVM